MGAVVLETLIISWLQGCDRWGWGGVGGQYCTHPWKVESAAALVCRCKCPLIKLRFWSMSTHNVPTNCVGERASLGQPCFLSHSLHRLNHYYRGMWNGHLVHHFWVATMQQLTCWHCVLKTPHHTTQCPTCLLLWLCSHCTCGSVIVMMSNQCLIYCEHAWYQTVLKGVYTCP